MLLELWLLHADLANDVPECIGNQCVGMLLLKQLQPVLFLFLVLIKASPPDSRQFAITYIGHLLLPHGGNFFLHSHGRPVPVLCALRLMPHFFTDFVCALLRDVIVLLHDFFLDPL